MIRVLPWPYVKKCWRCNEIKPISEFHSDKHNEVDWHARRCKPCHLRIKRSKTVKVFKTDEQRREARRLQGARKRRDLRLQIIEAYGGKCQCPGGCDERYEEFLALDHIDGKGAQHRREVGEKNVYRWLRRNGFPKDNFRLLCHNCNQSRASYGQCPHERHTGPITG